MRRALALVLLVPSLTSCGSGPRARFATALESGDVAVALEAYETYRDTEGGDRELLARVAALVLIEEAMSEDPLRRDAAITQITMAGTRGEPLLVELADEDGVPPARLGALLALARRGREPARLSLRALCDRQEPEVLSIAIYGMDAALDRGPLLASLTGSHADVRVSAATVLSGAAEVEEVREALAQCARVDDAPEVRAACVRSLGAAGPSAIDPLSERLSDPAAPVRLAAVTALMRADETRGGLVLAPLLTVDPSSAAIEAARLLAVYDSSSQQDALRFLERALRLPEPALRSQAAIALTGLPEDRAAPLDAVRDALAEETDPGVRLQFARALLRPNAPATHASAAREALTDLLSSVGIPAVQAAAILASENHAQAKERLRAFAHARGDGVVRRTAVRALARDALEPESVRALLRDDDAFVRIYAAGGILAAAAAG